jgi:hypothetical protein
MVRPCKIDTVHFRRTLSAAQRVQLLAAGAGCLSAGFNEILDTYCKLWAAGYRPGADLQNIDLVINANDNHSHLE